MDTLTVITLSLIVSFILGELVFRFRYPRVLGEITAGIVLGLPFFRQFFQGDSVSSIEFLSNLGTIFLFLMLGLQINLKKLKEASKNVFVVAFLCLIFPFLFGFLITLLLGYNAITALIIGIALSLTSESTNARLLLDLKLFDTKTGQIIFGAGLIDGLFGIIALAVILGFTAKTQQALVALPLKFSSFALIIYVIFKLIPRFIHHIEQERSRVATFSSMVITGLIIAVLAEKLGVGPLIGAFLAGIIIQLQNQHTCTPACPKNCLQAEYLERERLAREELRVFTYSLVIPFFFISVGLKTDFSRIHEDWSIAYIILIMAFAGKLLGAFLAKPFTDMTMTEAKLVGFGMNSRGPVELVIAETARMNGLIPMEMYNAIVLMAVVTTFFFPFVLKYYVSRGDFKPSTALSVENG